MANNEAQTNETPQPNEAEVSAVIEDAAEAMAEIQPEVSVEAEQAARIGELEDNIVRAAAELENLRKRSAKEVEDARKYGASQFARDMIEVLENLQRALENAPEDEGSKAFRDGVQMTYDSLLAAFEKQGVQRIEPLGEAFDHHTHQAVARKETDEHAPNTVTNVVQAGYVLNERLLRPAIVEVSVAPIVNSE